MTMPATMLEETDAEQMRRLTDFASDVTRLAAERQDLDLRSLVADLHADLLKLRAAEEDR
jgi:hypothetical protein